MARTAAELVAALDSGEPSRVLRTPEGAYTTHILDFCKELWEVDPMAQDANVKAAIAALPHPSHWEDEAAARATITQWLSVLSVASSQFSRDPLAWRDKTRPPETHRDRPWINSFTFKPLPGQVPAPFTMGTETWHRSGGGGIRLVAGKEPASYGIYFGSGPLAWRTATTMDLRKYQEKGLQGYGVRSPFPNAPAHQLTLDRLYSHLLYCVMDCPPPGYEPAPPATWKVIPAADPATRFGEVKLSLSCVTPGVVYEWQVTSSRGRTWTSNLPDAPVRYKKYSVGQTISWQVAAPPGGWEEAGTDIRVVLDGQTFVTFYTPPTAQWEAKVTSPLTRAEGGTLKPTLRCTRRGYLWGGWSYATPTGWERIRATGDPDYNRLYEVGEEVSLSFKLAIPLVGDPLLTPRTATLSMRDDRAEARYQPALATFTGSSETRTDPSQGSLEATLTASTAGYLVSAPSTSVSEGWTSIPARGTRGQWVEAGATLRTTATRSPGTSKATEAVLTLAYESTRAICKYAPPYATWEVHGEATKDYTRFTFQCLTEGITPWVRSSYSPELPSDTTATFEREMPLGVNGWAEKGSLGSIRYVFSKPLKFTTTTTLTLIQSNGTPLGPTAQATFTGEPRLSTQSPFKWLGGDTHAVQGIIQADSPGIISSQGWTQSPSNGSVGVTYYPEPGKGEAPSFPLTVKAGATFSVTCTWLASQDGLAKSLAYRLGTQQWSWTS